jgi:phosphate starvation-inducible PhoH-like protein
MSKRPRFTVVPGADEEEPSWHPLDEREGARRGRAARHAPAEPRYVKNIVGKSDGQRRLLAAVEDSDIVMAIGPAGTGKTYIAIAKAVEALASGKVKRLVLTRPAVEAGERIGFLPGDLNAKMDPYMRPLYDALFERMSPRQVMALIEQKVIEIAPIGFMRGRTISNAAIVVDEAQNMTAGQLKMVLTRLGAGSFMVVTGDPDQVDLDDGDSGLVKVAEQIDGKVDSIAVVRLDETDVVRHPTVKALIPLLVA